MVDFTLPLNNYQLRVFNDPGTYNFNDFVGWNASSGGSFGDPLPSDWFVNDLTPSVTQLRVYGNGYIQIDLSNSSAVLRSDYAAVMDVTVTSDVHGSPVTATQTGVTDANRRSPLLWEPDDTAPWVAFFNALQLSGAGQAATLSLEATVLPAHDLGPITLGGGSDTVSASVSVRAPTRHPIEATAGSQRGTVDARIEKRRAVKFIEAGVSSYSGSVGIDGTTRTKPLEAGVSSHSGIAGVDGTTRIKPFGAGSATQSGATGAVILGREPAIKSIEAGATSVPATVGTGAIRRIPTEPDAPQRLALQDVGQEFAVIVWEPPGFDGLETITGYEIQFFGEAWVAAGDEIHRLTSIGATEIRAGRSYRVRVRALNRIGASDPSEVLSFRSGAVTMASEPLFVMAESAGPARVKLSWRVPDDLGGGSVTGWQTRITYPSGISDDWEDVDLEPGDREWIARGLAEGIQYGFGVRAVNEGGPGRPASDVHATPLSPAVPIIADGQDIPLLPDNLRQSLVVRIEAIDCLISVWWQPRSSAWFARIEVPANTVAASGVRIAPGAGLLDYADDRLRGNIICRALDSADDRLDLGVDAFTAPSHALTYVA